MSFRAKLTPENEFGMELSCWGLLQEFKASVSDPDPDPEPEPCVPRPAPEPHRKDRPPLKNTAEVLTPLASFL